MILSLNKNATLCSADTMTRRIKAIFNQVRPNIIKSIRNNESKLSFTTDMWTCLAGINI